MGWLRLCARLNFVPIRPGITLSIAKEYRKEMVTRQAGSANKRNIQLTLNKLDVSWIYSDVSIAMLTQITIF
jgi:hypothetical protein